MYIQDVLVDHMIPVEQAEVTSSATVNDHHLLLSASLQTSEAFVRTWALISLL